MPEKIEKILLSLAKKADNLGEIPVGAVLVKNNKIYGKGFNNRQKQHDVTGHAEIMAIRKTSKKIKDWRLDGFELYVTLEPCEMCQKIIKESRITKVYYMCSQYKNHDNGYIKLKNNELYEKMFHNAFKKLRK